MQHKVEICGVNTAKLKVLKSDETRELLIRSKAGDQQAREALIAGNLRLVLSVIQRFTNRGENADDLFQVGCIGLIKAIDNFDVNLQVKFSTYGVPMRCSLGKRKESIPKWLKTEQFQWFLNVHRHICQASPTSARNMTRTRISISRLVIQNGLTEPSVKLLSILLTRTVGRRR